MSKLSNIMSEKIPPQIEKPRSEWPIEQQANFEGSWTNLMCERLRNPEIRRQIIDILCEIEQSESGSPIGEKFVDGIKKKYLIKNFDKETPVLERYAPRTRKQIESEFNQDLRMVEQSTPITFDERCFSDVQYAIVGGREIISPNNTQLTNGKKPTKKVLNIAESHEKGHLLRLYNFVQSRGKGLLERVRECEIDAKFAEAFDFSKIDCSEQYQKIQEILVAMGRPVLVSEKDVQLRIQSYLKLPMEISERMSQLKNYFGMNGNEKFTKEHLAYGRGHYVNDTDFDNDMTQFFQAITPEKEDAFIELINSAGI